MLKNYLTTTLRTLRKHPTYTAINIFGLAVGVACCVLIMLFVRHEWSFDRFHEHSDRLFRAWGHEEWGEGRTFFYTVTPIPLAPTLEETFPEVEDAVRVDPFTDLVGPEENRFTERIHMVDDTFFEVFSFPLRHGDPARVLQDRNSVVITPEMAAKYFGSDDPLGRTLPIQIAGAVREFKVSGIAEEPPAASSIRFDLLISFANSTDLYSERALQSWFNINPETYVLLREDVDVRAVEAKLPLMVEQILGEEADEVAYTVGLQPITDIHLNQHFPAGIEPTSDPKYAYLLSAIALLVLLIAAINFVTLSIGQSALRAREVGIRKAIGAPRI